MTRTVLKEKIYDWLSGSLTAIPLTTKVIRTNEDGVRPATPYLTYGIISDGRRGLPYNGLRNPVSGVSRIHSIKDFTVSLQSYGEDSDDIIEKLLSEFETDRNLQLRSGLGLSFLSSGAILEAQLITDKQTEQRFVVDLFMSVGNIQTEDQGYIKTIEIVSDFE